MLTRVQVDLLKDELRRIANREGAWRSMASRKMDAKVSWRRAGLGDLSPSPPLNWEASRFSIESATRGRALRGLGFPRGCDRPNRAAVERHIDGGKQREAGGHQEHWRVT